MISAKEILMGRITEAELSHDLAQNLQKLLLAVNKLRADYNKPMRVSSGYRSPATNKAVGGAARSNHMICAAVDFYDKDGAIDNWCMANLDKLNTYGLYLEHPDATSGWCHLQIVAPKSGSRVFRP